MTSTKPSLPDITAAPELLERLLRLSAGHAQAADCAQALLDTVNRYLWDGSTFEEAQAVGETLALCSLGVKAPGTSQNEQLEEKFRVVAPEIHHPRRVLGASSFLVSLLSQEISPGLKDGAERLIVHLKDAYPFESGIRDINATQW